MTTLDTPFAAAAAYSTLARLTRLAWRILSAIGEEIAYMISEDWAHGRIASHRDQD